MTKLHADAGFSSSKMWLACPASITLTRGVAGSTSPYARRGTAMHEAAEAQILSGGGLEMTSMTVEGEEIAIDDEMREQVDTYVGFADFVRHGADRFFVEKELSLAWFFAPLPMPEPVFGYADLLAYYADTKTLLVADFKTGSVPVDADTPQLLGYALMALGLPELDDVEVTTIRTVIVQPIAGREPIKSRDIPIGDLLIWASETLVPALERLAAGDTTEAAGAHCRYCKRSAVCGALREHSLVAVKAAFADMPAQDLTDDELGAILSKAEIIQVFVEAVRKEVAARLERGGEIAGWKLVQKVARRRWKDEVSVINYLSEAIGNVDDLFEPMTLRSPAQVEKVLKRYGVDPLEIEPFVTRESSGTTLARASDKREAVKRLTAAEAFAD